MVIARDGYKKVIIQGNCLLNVRCPLERVMRSPRMDTLVIGAKAAPLGKYQFKLTEMAYSEVEEGVRQLLGYSGVRDRRARMGGTESLG